MTNTNKQRDAKGRFVASQEIMAQDDEPLIVATSNVVHETARPAIQNNQKMLCPSLASTCDDICAQVKTLTLQLLKAETRVNNLQSNLIDGGHPKYYTWKADPMWSDKYKTDDIKNKISQLKKDSYQQLIQIDLEIGNKTITGINAELSEIKERFFLEADFIGNQLIQNGVKDSAVQITHDKKLFTATVEKVENDVRTKFVHDQATRDKRRHKINEKIAEDNIQQTLSTSVHSALLKRLEKLEQSNRKQEADKQKLEKNNKLLASEISKLKQQGNEPGKSSNQTQDGAAPIENQSPTVTKKKRRRPKSLRRGKGTEKVHEEKSRNSGSEKGNSK